MHQLHETDPFSSRYFALSIEGLEGRAELLGCLKGGTYSQSHIGLSSELALANPELTLPMFCGEYMVVLQGVEEG